MNKRTVLLVCAALALAAAYLTFFIDWQKGTEIHIFSEKSRRAILGRSDSPGIIFHLDKPYPLTSIKVVAAEEARTNKYPHAFWHLVAAGGPVRTTSFGYGAAIAGMKPKISGVEPEPLEAGTKYSLLLEAGKNLKGQITFEAPL